MVNLPLSWRGQSHQYIVRLKTTWQSYIPSGWIVLTIYHCYTDILQQYPTGFSTIRFLTTASDSRDSEADECQYNIYYLVVQNPPLCRSCKTLQYLEISKGVIRLLMLIRDKKFSSPLDKTISTWLVVFLSVLFAVWCRIEGWDPLWPWYYSPGLV